MTYHSLRTTMHIHMTQLLHLPFLTVQVKTFLIYILLRYRMSIMNPSTQWTIYGDVFFCDSVNISFFDVCRICSRNKYNDENISEMPISPYRTRRRMRCYHQRDGNEFRNRFWKLAEILLGAGIFFAFLLLYVTRATLSFFGRALLWLITFDQGAKPLNKTVMLVYWYAIKNQSCSK